MRLATRLAAAFLASTLVLAPSGGANAQGSSKGANPQNVAVAARTQNVSPKTQSAAASQALPAIAIKIVPGSTIHLVARSSKLPVSIQNDFPVNVRVQVHVAPNNLSALIPAAIEVNVPANTTYVAQVPVTAIADGDVTLKAWLTTFSGISLGNPVDLNLVINAEIEESLVGAFVLIVAGLAVVGVIRTRRKRAGQPT